MKPQVNKEKHRNRRKRKSVFFRVHLWLIIFAVFLTACAELEKPKTEPYYAQTTPPPKQEFRWSNGKTPKSFDPALAAAPPETDVIRAVYEGLTVTDSKNLEPVPAVALKWKSEEENKIWTFELRRDAKWSNGESVTAEDFVRSWKRLGEMRKDVSHPDLLNNIVGLHLEKKEEIPAEKPENSNETNVIPNLSSTPNLPVFNKTPVNSPKTLPLGEPKKTEVDPDSKPNSTNETKSIAENKKESEAEKFGVEAVDAFTLKVTLIKSDKDFPALVAHPIFSPVFTEAKFEKELNSEIITNGAFKIVSVGQDGIALDRAENYWNKNEVKLERVRFVPMESAEKALEAYRSGELDAVTNAEFEPLALKLLTPYEDFRRTVHSALNFYEFNQKKAPFNDKRVREALAISIERERLTDDEMDGATKPALGFLPYNEADQAKLKQDSGKAQKLLTEAGFPNGENFPKVKLLINRNNIQQRIARSVAKMWKQNLNIETEIIVKESKEIEAIREEGEYDIIRRGVVLPTVDETANMLAIFASEKPILDSIENQGTTESEKQTDASENSNAENDGLTNETELSSKPFNINEPPPLVFKNNPAENKLILTEEHAIESLPAIPLYFPTSYSLVKPYVMGFEINTLDAPSLKDVSIDNYWQPKKIKGES